VAWTLGLSDHLNIHLPMNLMTGLGRSACGENHEGGREQLMKRSERFMSKKADAWEIA
jgi:hypothetical protein